MPRWWSVLKQGLRGAAVSKARAHHPRGTGSPAQVVVAAQGGPAGGRSPRGPGTRPRGTGTLAQAVVGAHGVRAGGSSLQGPGTLP